MLLSKYNRAAGELEGARPASSWIIAIKNVRQDFLTSVARFFVKRKLHKKCGVFEACKKAIGFFDTLKESTDLRLCSRLIFAPNRHNFTLHINCVYAFRGRIHGLIGAACVGDNERGGGRYQQRKGRYQRGFHLF